MLEAQASAARNMPPRPQMALSDIDLYSSRDSSVDSHSVAGTNMAGYFAGPRPSVRFPPDPQTRAPSQPPFSNLNEAPWSPERRRSSLLRNSHGYPASWPYGRPTPTPGPPPLRDNHHSRPLHHQRADSDLSTISTSTSDTSSIKARSTSISPVHYHAQLHRPRSAGANGYLTGLPPQRPVSHPQGYQSPRRNSCGPSASVRNVRWQDMDDIFDGPRYGPQSDGRPGGDVRYGYGNKGSDDISRGRPARSVGPNTGVGGRRYPGGVSWR